MEEIIRQQNILRVYLFKFFGIVYLLFAILFLILNLGFILSILYYGLSKINELTLFAFLDMIGFGFIAFGLFSMKRWVVPLVVAQSLLSVVWFLTENLLGGKSYNTIYIFVVLMVFLIVSFFTYLNRKYFIGNYFDKVFSTIIIITLFGFMSILPAFLSLEKTIDKRIFQNQSVENNQYQIDSWKTYRNNKYGFEIKYKPEWQVKYFINSALVLDSKNLQSGATEVSDSENANDIVISGYGYSAVINVKEINPAILDDLTSTISTTIDGNSTTIAKKKIEVDGIPAYDEKIIFMEISRRTIYFVKKINDATYKFNINLTSDVFTPEKLDNLEFEKMVSSFKFTK